MNFTNKYQSLTPIHNIWLEYINNQLSQDVNCNLCLFNNYIFLLVSCYQYSRIYGCQRQIEFMELSKFMQLSTEYLHIICITY